MSAPQNVDETLLYSVAGSQFVAKTMTALDALKVPYKVVYVDFLKLKQQTVPPHTVPQMRWRGDMLTDSSDILKRVDQDCTEAPFKLYPAAQKKEIEELEQHAGTILHGHVIYYTWWIENGFQETIVKYITAQYWPLPSFLVYPIMQMTMDVGRMRGASRKKARGILGESLIPQGRDPKPEEEENMTESLLKQFRELDARFASESQQWLCKTEQPSAADFSVYGMVERLVGTNGDAGMGIVAPWLWAEANTPKLKAWYERMREAYPIQFKGKAEECKVWAKA